MLRLYDSQDVNERLFDGVLLKMDDSLDHLSLTEKGGIASMIQCML